MLDPYPTVVHMLDAAARAARERRDELAPAITGFDIGMKRAFVGSGERKTLESALGTHLFRLWETDLATFKPEIEADLVEEAKLGSQYTELIAGMSGRAIIAPPH